MSNQKFVNRGSRSQRSVGSMLITVLVALALWWFNGGSSQILNQSGDNSSTGSQTQGQVETVDQNSQNGALVESQPSSNSTTNQDVAARAAGRSAPAGMSIVVMDSLPPEAIDTIQLIWSDGPYPFDKDDTTFQNREGFLPDEDRGYYREYTVITPGLNHRGARRIVSGAQGELYYTDDHYASFSWVNVE